MWVVIVLIAGLLLQRIRKATPVQNNKTDAIVQQFEREIAESLKGAKSWDIFFDQTDDAADAAVTKILATLNPDETAKLHDRVKELITMGAGGQSPLIDEPLIRTCQTLLQFTIAALSLALIFSQRIASLPLVFSKTIVCVAIFFVGLLLTALAVLTLHALQGRFRFPFLYLRRIGNPWSWFYYGCISPETPRSPLQPGSNRKNQGASFYATDFVKFAGSAVSKSEADALRDDLQHLFLVMSYQGYVHQFSLQISKAFVYGVTGSIAGLGVSLALVWLRIL